jgi:hypothetical protein
MTLSGTLQIAPESNCQNLSKRAQKLKDFVQFYFFLNACLKFKNMMTKLPQKSVFLVFFTLKIEKVPGSTIRRLF